MPQAIDEFLPDLDISPDEAAAISRSTDIEVRSRTNGRDVITDTRLVHGASLFAGSLPHGSRVTRRNHIVMGTHGGGGGELKGRLLGAVATGVLGETSIPGTVIR